MPFDDPRPIAEVNCLDCGAEPGDRHELSCDHVAAEAATVFVLGRAAQQPVTT